MAIQLVLREDQLEALSVIRDLGSESLQAIIDKISNLSPPPIRPAELRKALSPILVNAPGKIEIVIEQLLSLYTLRRQRRISAAEIVEGLNYGIESARNRWDENQLAKWQAIQQQLLHLFDIPNIWLAVKSLDLSYDYSKLLQSVKILTDIRPVYNADASQIEGSVVSYTLRISYDSRDGNKSISIALDENDVRSLLEVSERALKKSQTAKRFMIEKGNVNAFICGEEE